jgi:hypothetical protein
MWFIIILPVIIFFKGLFTYFVQDDFLLLFLSQAKNIGDFVLFFKPLSETVWYRPLSSQIFFFIGKTLFGLHPFGFHLLALLTHMATIFGVYLFTQKLTKNKTAAILSGLFYGSHQLHVISLGWLASFSFVLGPFFLIFGLYAYTQKKYLWALAILILGLLTSEVLIILLPLYAVVNIIRDKVIALHRLIIFSLPVVAVLIGRLLIVPTINNSTLYKMSISTQTVSVFKFYLLRILGVPYFIEGMPFVLKILIMVLLALFIVVLSIAIYHHIRSNTSKRASIVAASVAVFGLIPFLLLKEHTAPYYGSFALIGVAIFEAIVVSGFTDILTTRIKNIFIYSVVIIFLFLQQIGSYWTYDTHWIFRRALLAKNLVDDKKYSFPVGSEEYYALGASAAEKLFDQK